MRPISPANRKQISIYIYIDCSVLGYKQSASIAYDSCYRFIAYPVFWDNRFDRRRRIGEIENHGDLYLGENCAFGTIEFHELIVTLGPNFQATSFLTHLQAQATHSTFCYSCFARASPQSRN